MSATTNNVTLMTSAENREPRPCFPVCMTPKCEKAISFCCAVDARWPVYPVWVCLAIVIPSSKMRFPRPHTDAFLRQRSQEQQEPIYQRQAQSKNAAAKALTYRLARPC